MVLFPTRLAWQSTFWIGWSLHSLQTNRGINSGSLRREVSATPNKTNVPEEQWFMIHNAPGVVNTTFT
jgi:hypothetical protein